MAKQHVLPVFFVNRRIIVWRPVVSACGVYAVMLVFGGVAETVAWPAWRSSCFVLCGGIDLTSLAKAVSLGFRA